MNRSIYNVNTEEADECYPCGNRVSCYRCYNNRWRCKLVTKGIFVRFLFILYIVMCFVFTHVAHELIRDAYQGRVVAKPDIFDGRTQHYYAALIVCLASISALILETCVTLCCTKYGAWKPRFSPVMLIFLCGSIPQLFLLESAKISVRDLNLDSCESSIETGWKDRGLNGPWDCQAAVCGNLDLHPTSALFERAVLGYEQGLVILLVVGRWLLPRGKMSRAKLSDMLFAFIGMAMDIQEFLQAGLDVGGLACDKSKSFWVLGITVISLTQFIFDLDLFIGMHSMKKRNKTGQYEPSNNWTTLFKNPEAQTILMNMLLQDFPFLTYRVYLIISFEHHPDDLQNLYFFMTKNILVLALQGYRLWIILKNVSISREKLVERIQKKERSNHGSFDLNTDIFISRDLAMTIRHDTDSGPISTRDLIDRINQACEQNPFPLNEDIKIGDRTLTLSIGART